MKLAGHQGVKPCLAGLESAIPSLGYPMELMSPQSGVEPLGHLLLG